MGEALPEGVSRQEFSDLAAGVKELREAMAELRQARSEPERREARAEVRDDAKETVKETAPEPPQPDTAPGLGHWSERPLSSLFGGEGK